MKKALIGAVPVILLQATLAWAQLPVEPPAVTSPVPPRSVITAYNTGSQYPYRTNSNNGTVRSFDPATGKLTLQDGYTYWVPKNFALANQPEVGQPVTIYYRVDHVYYRVDPGQRIVQSLEMGQVDRS